MTDAQRSNRADEAMESFLEQYIPLVRKIANKLLNSAPPSIELDDLVQSGTIGLLEARSRYRSVKGASFAAFAVLRVRGAILDTIRQSTSLSRGAYQSRRSVEEVKGRLESRNRGPVRQRAIAEELGFSKEKFARLQCEFESAHRVDFGSLANAEVLPAALLDDRSPESILQREELAEHVSCAIAELTEVERCVVALYDYRSVRLRDIGTMMDVSESRVSQLRTGAIASLRATIGDHLDLQ